MTPCPKAPGLLTRLLSRLYPEDPQAAVTLTASVVLLGVAVRIAEGIVHQLKAGHDIGWGTVGAMTVALAAPCALAHVKAPAFPIGSQAQSAPGVAGQEIVSNPSTSSGGADGGNS